MKNLNLIGEELFNKIRGRFPSVTIGDGEGKVTNAPGEARFFDFDFKEGATVLGRISVSLNEKSLSVIFSNNIIENQDEFTKQKWYGFLKELRYFAKKRLLNFDTRDITKSNLNRRDYKFLAQTSGETTMSESKLYGTSKTSYQDVGTARLTIKHTKPINQELAAGRTQHIETIYIESSNGERFKYPYKHLGGARAMARHVAEGGNTYDEFGKHIVGLSEELGKLRKFKNYVNRSNVMAESLLGYMDIVNERIDTVKKTLEGLQRQTNYKEAFENFETTVMEDVPDEVAENWIDELTIKQFNEELKDVFPYIYKLVGEGTKAKSLGPNDIIEGPIDFIKDKFADFKKGREDRMAQYKQDLHILRTVLGSHGYDDATIKKVEDGCLNDPRVCLYNLIRKNNADTGDMDMEVDRIGKELNSGFTTFSGTTDEDAVEESEDLVNERNDFAAEVAQKLHQKGIRYDYEDEREIIMKMASLVKELGHERVMSDKDFVADVLDDLANMDHDDDDYDGQPSSYDEYQDLYGGDDDPADYMDFESFENWADNVVESGLDTVPVDEGYMKGYKKYHCEDCGCQMHNCKPDCQCEHDSHDETGSWWKDENGNGVPDALEGNKFSKELKKARDNGDDEIELDGKKIPVTEFVLSLFDRQTGQFPKGETAVLTAVEKDYGEQYINGAKEFIEAIKHKFEEHQMRTNANDMAMERIKSLAGLQR